ncbi:MAG: DnaJ domain-containing protein [Nitrospiraceae bacterium]|nr:DnaJ domain-containing protein [Nitrospiraceae bacterium]
MGTNDKRRFRRYRKGSVISVKLKDSYYHAKLTDYSVEGLGLIIETGPEISEGDVIDVAIEEPAIRAPQKVIWKGDAPHGVRIGLRNVGHLAGLVKDHRLSDILLGMHSCRKTGILTVEYGGFVKKVFIRDGDMVFSSSSDRRDNLADILLREGRMSAEQHKALFREMERTGRKEGALLVEMDCCEAKDLVPLVRRQIEEIILGLLSLGKGRFSIEETELPANEILTLKLSAPDLIYSGTKRVRDVRRIAEVLPSLDVIPALSLDMASLSGEVKLDEAGRRVLACIDGKTSIAGIVSLTGLDRLEVLRTVFAILNLGMAEVKATPQTGGEKGDAADAGGQRPSLDPEVLRAIEELHGKYMDLGYYGVLGVKPHAAFPEIKSAYYRAAKKYHPDIHFNLADDPLKGKLSDIFSYIYEAYTTLGNPEKRREYDKSVSVKPMRPVSAEEKAKIKCEEGRTALRNHTYAEAELLFGQAAYFDPSVADYHYYYGLALFRQDKAKAAEKAIARALKLEPFNATYLAELGFVFAQLGFPARAKGLFEKALKVSPNHERAAAGIAGMKSP